MLKNKRIILLSVLSGTFLFWFFLTKNNFFHWDEWSFLMSFNQPPASFLTKPYGEHYLPLNLLNHFLLFKTFGLNNLPFQISVIIFHVINTFLIFKIIFKETKKSVLALLGAILFGISNVFNEDVIWSQGISSVGSAMLISLAFYSFLHFQDKKNVVWVVISVVSLLLSPLFNAFGTLAPFAFALISLLRIDSFQRKKIYFVLYSLLGAVNLFILFHFSSSQIGKSTQTLSVATLYKIPEFIAYGIVRGNVLRFFFPGLHLVVGQQQFKSIFFLLFILIAAVVLIKFLFGWLQKRQQRWQKIAILLSYSSLIIVGYLAASIGRISYGLDQAGIARYSYQSFFFLIVLVMILLKDVKKIKLIIALALFFWTLNLYALLQFEKDQWGPMVSRDRQFAKDVRYLLANNATVYDFPANGIYPTIKLSKLWFLKPKSKRVQFINPNQFPASMTLASPDQNSQKIYWRLKGDYQKKLD